MKRRVALAGSIILAAVACLWVAAAGRGDLSAGQPASEKALPEVGKIYTFEFGGPQGSQTGEVVEGPRDN
jgi:hypothetical protein